jgi:hypothetical protein
MNVAVLVLIGSARLRRRHFKSRKLLNNYRAGAHYDLVTHDVSALFSVYAVVLAAGQVAPVKDISTVLRLYTFLSKIIVFLSYSHPYRNIH